jgi:DNA-binding MarR family transcriptional regulator
MEKSDALSLWRLSYRVTVATIASVMDEVAALGLEWKELNILDAIPDHPHPAALAERLMIPKPTMTAYLKRLEAAGFVRREIDPEDLRRHRLTVTAAGKKLAQKGMSLFSEAFGTRLARLSPTQRATLAELLEAMSD